MNLLDNILVTVAPKYAVKRAAARATIQAINSGYGNYGASLHKRTVRGWRWNGGSPKEDIEDNLRVLRERSRDAYMGIPIANGTIKTKCTNTICGGLTPTPQVDGEFLGLSDEEAQKLNTQLLREFSLWADQPTCDADGIDDFYMLQQLAFIGFLMNGDALILFQMKRTPNVPYNLRLRVVEADRLCSPGFMDIISPTEIQASNGKYRVEKIVQGVETDADGMVVAYWICDQHPLASMAATISASHWTRVEIYGKKTGRRNAVLLLQRERAGQVRGVPLLAPVLESLKQIGRFTEAELTAAVISAMFTVFIKKTDQTEDQPFGELTVQENAPDYLAKNDIALGPGAFVDLAPGEEVQFAEPKHPSTTFESFMNAMVKQLAAATETPSEVLYKQFSTSYSAARGALNEFWRSCEMNRDWFASRFCQAAYEALIYEAVCKGRIRAPGFLVDPAVTAAYLHCTWNGPARTSLNPKDEVEAAKMRVDSCFSTAQQETAQMTGGNFMANVRQRKSEAQAKREVDSIAGEQQNQGTVREQPREGKAGE